MNFTYSDCLGLTLVFDFSIYIKQWPKPLAGSGIFSTHLVLLSLLIIKNFVPQPNKEDGWKKTSYTNLKNTSSCVTHVTTVATSPPSPLPNAVAVNVWSTWVNVFHFGGGVSRYVKVSLQVAHFSQWKHFVAFLFERAILSFHTNLKCPLGPSSLLVLLEVWVPELSFCIFGGI